VFHLSLPRQPWRSEAQGTNPNLTYTVHVNPRCDEGLNSGGTHVKNSTLEIYTEVKNLCQTSTWRLRKENTEYYNKKTEVLSRLEMSFQSEDDVEKKVYFSISCVCYSSALLAEAEEMGEVCLVQGCLRRKTVLKDGRKPAVAAWQRYWVQLWPASLIYYPPKSFKG